MAIYYSKNTFDKQLPYRNACPRTYNERRSRAVSQRYTYSCGLFGFGSCSAYRYVM